MNPIKIFISYAHEDESFKNALVRHLSGLDRNELLDTWHDRKIAPGSEWGNEIKTALESADIIVFLVSSYFMASDYIHDVEIKNTLDRQAANQQIIIPVLVRPCDFSSLSLSKFQTLPTGVRAVSSWSDQEEAWTDVTLGIKKVVFGLHGKSLPVLEDITGESQDPSVKEKITLHDFHRYTCDRRAPFATFEEHYTIKKKSNPQFYYVVGKEEQSHFGFMNRLAYERGGHLLDIDNNALNTSKLLIEEILLQNINELKHIQIRLIRELMAKLNIVINACDPILDKDLSFVCKESPLIQKMDKTDYVTILLSIYEDEWDEEKTPALVRWFISEFCKVALPDDAPNFLFFFGIIYEEGDEAVKASVNEAIANSQLGIVLPELKMVVKKDIIKWFRKYKIIAPDSEVRAAFMEAHFSDENEFEMETVEIELQKIIDQFNAT